MEVRTSADLQARFQLDTKQAEAQAAALEKRLQGPFQPRVDDRQVQGLIRQLEQGAALQVRANITAAESRLERLRTLVAQSGEVQIDADTGAARNEINDLFDELDERATIQAGVEVDDAQLAAINDRLSERFTIKADVDLDEGSLSNVEKRLEERRTIKADVDLDDSEARSKLANLDDAVDFSNIGGSLTDALENAVSSTGPAGRAVSAAGVALGAAIGKAIGDGIERGASEDVLTSSLGLTGPGAERAIRQSSALFADAYGESFEDVASIVADATAIGIPNLETMVGLALSLEAAFDVAGEELLTLGGQLQTQGVVDDIEEFLDFTTASFQQLPSVLREPLLEAVEEYGIFGKAVGLTTEEIFAGFTDAATRGEFELDKFGDAIKEFTIRATDDSSTTREAFAQIGVAGEEYTDLVNTLIEGGPKARDSFFQIVEGVLAIDDPITRANTAIGLFGTPLEDLAVSEIPRFLESLKNMEGGLGDVEGAAADLDAQINDNLQVAITGYTRQWSEALTGLGTALVGTFTGADNRAEVTAAGEELGTLAGEALAAGVKVGFDLTFDGTVSGINESLLSGFAGSILPDVEVAGFDIVGKLSSGIGRGLEEAVNPFSQITNSIQEIFGPEETAQLEGFAGALDMTAVSAERAAEGTRLFDLNTKFDSAQQVIEDNRRLAEQLDAVDGGAGRASQAFIDMFGELEEGESQFDAINDAMDSTLERLEFIAGIGATSIFRNIIEEGENLVELFIQVEDAVVDVNGEFDRTTKGGRLAESALEDYRERLLDLTEAYANGQISASEFVDGQNQVRETVREAVTQLGVSGDVLDGLVAKYGELSAAEVARLQVIVDANLEGLDTAEKAVRAFGLLSAVAVARIDYDNSGAVEAEEALAVLDDLAGNIEVGFDIDESGVVEVEEATRSLENLEFLIAIGFDTNFDNLTDAREQAEAFDAIAAFAEVGFDVDQDGVLSAREQGVAFAAETWLASLGLTIDDVLSGAAEAREASDRYAQREYTAFLRANNADALAESVEAQERATTFADDRYIAQLQGNASDANQKTSGARENARRFADGSYVARLRGDNSNALAQADQAKNRASNVTRNPYFLRLNGVDNASGVINRVRENERSLPNSHTIRIDADGSFADNEIRRLRSLASSTVTIPVRTSSGARYSFDGRIVDRPMVTHVGEGYRPEIIAPLTNMSRTVDLFGQAQALPGLVDELARRGALDRVIAEGLRSAAAPPPQDRATTVAAPVAPIINVNPPEGVNAVAWSQLALQQVARETERAVAGQAAGVGRRGGER